MKLPLLAEPLRHRDFRLLWAGQGVSMFGNFVHGVALPFQFFALGATAVQIGAGFALLTASQLVLLLFGGAIVDRVPRRRVILASDLVSGIVATAVGALSLTGSLRTEHLYFELAVFGGAAAFFMPAIGAIIPELVPGEILTQGNALRGLSRQFARVAGPATGGLIVVSVGPGWAFLFDGLTFFLSFAALLATRPPTAEARDHKHILREIREGIAFTFSVPWLWITIAIFALYNTAFSGPISVGIPLFIRDVLGADAQLFGLSLAAVGLGEFAGGIFVAQAGLRRIGIAMYVYSIVGGLAIAGVGLVPSIPTLFAFAVTTGVCLAGFGTLWETAVQRNVPRELLGRVGSVDWFGSFLLGPVAPVLAGIVIQSYGTVPLFIGAGAMAAALGCVGVLVPSIRALRA
ncbi:MAG TPA: MFS transporter [Candidatus Limnocylindria bacterium]|nr:MFS transporter [Candidatus Limnocylindria bacterium]